MKMNKLLKKVDKVKHMLTAAVFMASMPLTVFADGVGGGSGQNAGTNAIVNILDNIVSFFPVAGVIFLFMGGFKLIQAIRADNNPEGISAAIKDFIVGALFIVFDVVVWNVLKGLI